MLKNNFTKISGASFSNILKKNFSHGPYNPLNYKHKLVGNKRITYI
jgi:hypothetical protein